MPEARMSLALAVLIDAENIAATLFDSLEREVRKLGEVVSWQLHGDLISWPHPGWQELAQSKGLEIRHQFHTGKNSSDIAMTIAAMDLLHGGKIAGFCLVSSDRDFAPLARRLRADAVPVYGFGEPKTSEPFRKACTRFFELHAKESAASAAPTAGSERRSPQATSRRRRRNLRSGLAAPVSFSSRSRRSTWWSFTRTDPNA
jgi:hypothetical protein